MRLEQKLPVTYLLFTFRGRIGRWSFLNAQLCIWLSFYILYSLIESSLGYSFTIAIYPLFFWTMLAVSTKRLHDTNRSKWHLLFALIPIIGFFWLFFLLFLRKGTIEKNSYGSSPSLASDYLQNGEAEKIPHMNSDERIVNDVTGLNPVIVAKVATPSTVEEVIELVTTTEGDISVGGGRFSMGGQTASKQSLHLDMRGLNKVTEFSKEGKRIKFQSGIRWCDIQEYIDEHDLSISIMQSYANFTVGGSLSVNVHGRYIGEGPLVLSVISIDIVLADGSLVHADRDENREIFLGAIGGYNALGVIVQAELRLSDNSKVKRVSKKMKRCEYHKYFVENIRDDLKAVFHNADLYPPTYERANVVTWEETEDKPTTKTRLMPLKDSYPVERYFYWAFSETPFGKFRREFIIDPILLFKKKVHWKNYEAGYDVAELEPKSRQDSTYVLLEYFVPVKNFDGFTEKMSDIFQRHNVNVINVSIRHAKKDSGTYLSWAREEVYAFVVYYKQKTDKCEKEHVAIWTREMIDAAISFNGSYYLPYQAHATLEQFHKAYPDANKLIKLKKKLDPSFKFRNVIWNQYLNAEKETMTTSESEFKKVFSDTVWCDKFFMFLQEIFHLYPESKFHELIKRQSQEGTGDQEIYEAIQQKLSTISPFLSDLTYGLPALKKQKKVITEQTLELLGPEKAINGYLEIGSTGRYISSLKKHISLSGEVYLLNEKEPDNSIGELFERGQFKKIGKFIPMNDYDEISEEQIPSESLDLVTCYIGIHHIRLEKIDTFIQSVHRVLRPGGRFILRDHDVKTKEMSTFVSLIHTVFNMGLNETWKFNQEEFRNFQSLDHWCEYLAQQGLKASEKRLLQDNDPSDNTLISFVKEK